MGRGSRDHVLNALAMTIESLHVDCYGLTDPGKVRTVNEDQFLIASMHKVMEIERTSLPRQTQARLGSDAMARLLLVADGVGGTAAGEQASGLALETVASYVTNSMKCFYQLNRELEQDLMHELESSVAKSHAMVRSAAEAVPGQHGMATTLTVVHVIWPTAYIVHVGDSRCYLLRQDALTQLTRDQTMAQDLVDRGLMSQETAEHSRWSHMLSSAVGHEIKPATLKASLEIGDTLLLCTDGLTKHLSDEEIAHVTGHADSARRACELLVNAALDDGGTDNITVIVCRFTEPTDA